MQEKKRDGRLSPKKMMSSAGDRHTDRETMDGPDGEGGEGRAGESRAGMGRTLFL